MQSESALFILPVDATDGHEQGADSDAGPATVDAKPSLSTNTLKSLRECARLWTGARMCLSWSNGICGGAWTRCWAVRV